MNNMERVDLSEIVGHLDYECRPNNWLKLHGLPKRRKVRGTRRGKRKVFFVDEIFQVVERDHNASAAFVENILKRARKTRNHGEDEGRRV